MTLDPNIDPESFIIPEHQVATILGVPLKSLRAKKGAEGQRWCRSENGQAMWSLRGLEATRDELTPAAGSDHPSPQKNAAPTPARAKSLLRVTRSGFPNRHVMRAALPKNGREVTVWVRDAWLFAPGMNILGSPREDRPDVYDFAGDPARPDRGPVLPLAFGRW